MFPQADWQDDRMTLNGWLFRIEHSRNDDWQAAGDHFRFYKVKGLIEQYEQAFTRLQFTAAQNIVELGMWDGGSLAFWFEVWRPRKIVGIDIADREDSAYFARYRDSNHLAEQIRTYWKTSQADTRRLQEIVRTEFSAPLDLVFDDASHLYAPTKRSFETLFPLLRPGGLYVIEDWAWEHWAHVTPGPEWSNERPLTPLVVELIEAAGTARGAIASVSVYSTFTIVERGALPLGANFRLDDQIFRRGKPPLPRRLLNRLMWGPHRDALARVKKALSSRGAD